MRKIKWTLALLIALPLVGGCVSPEDGRDSILSGAYWERHFDKIGDDMRGLRLDLDRSLFRIDDEPVELTP